jgi:Fic family protein
MKLAGYSYLTDKLELSVPPLGLELAVGEKSKDEIRPYGFGNIKLLAKNKKVGTTSCEHIETAITYQGIRLAYLVPIFEKIERGELESYIREKPQAVIRRCIWFLYEWLTDSRLDLEDSKSNYAFLLDEKFYFTLKNGVRNSRTRVINNLLGNRNFCPMIRKTKIVRENAEKNLMEMAQNELNQVHASVNPELLGRSLEYLYTKETQSSTEIEKENTATDKMRKFYRVLKTSGVMSLSRKRLLNIQNEIVRSDKKDVEYRSEEIYVGETRPTWRDGLEENIHYIGPKYDQVPSMMEGLLDMHTSLLLDNTLPPMMHAAILSFGFVYIHPFSDGNGRIHRYLIHDVLKTRITTEQDFIIPVSATILKHEKAYSSVLETMSKPVMALIDYDLDDETHGITINNDIGYLYRYPDLTPHVEFLYAMMETSISKDLMQEVVYLVKYDKVKKVIEDLYDIPNKELNLFIQLAIQNNGTINKKKRKRFKDWIDEAALSSLEQVIRTVLDDINKDM